MKLLSRLFIITSVIFFVASCELGEETINPKEETGFLKLGVALSIEELPAGRTAEVDVSTFKVTIFNADDNSVVIEFDPFSTAPPEIELVTGRYYIQAHSNNLVPAAFDNPYYFGESEIFTIDKEEIKEIDVNCEMANAKVSFTYSQNVHDDFTTWGATASLVNTGESLDFGDSETLEGYFILEPIRIDVHLSYTKVYDGGFITRDLSTTISAPEARTHYRINVDAALDDGKIVIIINVDDGVTVIDIDLNEETEPPPPPAEGELLPGSTIITSPEDEQKLLGWLDPAFHYEAELLFSKINDGSTAQDFHAQSDNVPDNLVLIKTTDGFIFGGYNEGAWDASAPGYVSGLTGNFLFSINNDEKWPLKQNSYGLDLGILNNSDLGPTFGAGYDLLVNSTLSGGSTYYYSYYLEGTDPDDPNNIGFNESFGGSHDAWVIEELEIWSLKTSGTPVGP